MGDRQTRGLSDGCDREVLAQQVEGDLASVEALRSLLIVSLELGDRAASGADTA